MIFSKLLESWANLMWRASWQGALIVALVWCICWMLPSMPSRLRSWLWRLAMLKFVVVLAWQTPVGIPLLPKVEHRIRATFKTRSIDAPIIEARPFPRRSSTWIVALFGCWVAGVSLQSIQIARAYFEVVRLRLACQRVDDRALLDEFGRISKSFCVWRPPDFLLASGSGSPFVTGVILPVVIIPKNTFLRLSSMERRLAISHELAHIHRCDLTWNLFAMFVRIPFFFHPLAWLGERQMMLAHEIAADELAIQRQQIDPISYGQLLVSIIEKIDSVAFLPAMTAGTTGSIVTLTRRLTAMRFANRVSRRAVFGSLALLVLLTLVGIVPWRLVTSATKPPILAVSESLEISPNDSWGIADNGNRTGTIAADGTFTTAGKGDGIQFSVDPQNGFHVHTSANDQREAGASGTMIGVIADKSDVTDIFSNNTANVEINGDLQPENRVGSALFNQPVFGVNLSKPKRTVYEAAINVLKGKGMREANDAIFPRGKGENFIITNNAPPIAVEIVGKFTIRYNDDTECSGTISTDDHKRLEVSIRTDRQKTPVEHSVVVKFIKNPESESPETSHCPRMTVFDGVSSYCSELQENGETLMIETSINPVPENE